MPGCNRISSICRDCYNDWANVPFMFSGQIEICKLCMSSYIELLEELERIYIIVPGVRRAQAGEEEVVYRWGEPDTIRDAIEALPAEPSLHELLWEEPLPAGATRPVMTFQGKSRRPSYVNF